MLQAVYIPPRVEETISKALSADPKNFWVKEITSSFAWAAHYHFYWGTTAERKNCVVAVDPAGRVEILTSANGWKQISMMLVFEKKALPGDLSAKEMAEAIRKLTAGPPGFVGSSELLQRRSPPLHAWLKQENQNEENRFKAFCLDPQYQRIGHAEWQLSFFYFNDRGGVEQWHVRGSANGIVEVNMKTAAADETFNWPFE